MNNRKQTKVSKVTKNTKKIAKNTKTPNTPKRAVPQSRASNPPRKYNYDCDGDSDCNSDTCPFTDHAADRKNLRLYGPPSDSDSDTAPDCDADCTCHACYRYHHRPMKASEMQGVPDPVTAELLKRYRDVMHDYGLTSQVGKKQAQRQVQKTAKRRKK